MPAAATVRGGRLHAVVQSVNFAGETFTIKVSGKGNEFHEQEITLPLSWWNGPGAVCHENDGVAPYPPENPRSKPRGGDHVIFDGDLFDASEGHPRMEKAPAEASAASDHADRAEKAADRAEKAAKAAKTGERG